MEELQQVDIILQSDQGCNFRGSEGGIASIYDSLEVVFGNLRRRNVQRQNLERKILVREIFPVLPVRGLRDFLGKVETAIVSETLEDDLLERELRGS